MRFTLFFILSFFTMTNAGAQFSGKRQVFIFGVPQSKAVTRQLALFEKETAGVAERDMEITLVAKEMKWYKKYKVAPDTPFTLILVGKDGGEKYRSEKPAPAAELFALIDAMPMRQSEMRRASKPGQ